MKSSVPSWSQKSLAQIAKAEWGNTSITKASYVDAGFPAFSASGADGFLPTAEWDGPGVILSAIGARCGKCFYADGKWTAIKNTIVIQADDSTLSHKFLFYYLNDATRWKISGSGQPFITLKTVRETSVPLPSLSQQIDVVSEIEKQFTRLDAGVAALRRVQANLKRYRAAVLKAACEGRLVTTEAELANTGKRKADFEAGEALLARILTERRKNWLGRGQFREPATFDASRASELPNGWAWTNIGQLGEVGTGATPNRGKTEYFFDGTVAWVTSGCVNSPRVEKAEQFVTTLALEECNLTIYPPGTLLLAMYGEGKTRGMASELDINAATNQALAAIQVPQSIRGFVKVVLWKNYDDVRKAASGGVQPNLNLSIVRAIGVPLPPLAEQTRIVAEVERRLSVVEELEAVLSVNLQRSIRLRQSVLRKAFTGDVL
jgi:type I restriction enzyme S subunit